MKKRVVGLVVVFEGAEDLEFIRNKRESIDDFFTRAMQEACAPELDETPAQFAARIIGMKVIRNDDDGRKAFYRARQHCAPWVWQALQNRPYPKSFEFPDRPLTQEDVDPDPFNGDGETEYNPCDY